jgi:hypothetical protein
LIRAESAEVGELMIRDMDVPKLSEALRDSRNSKKRLKGHRRDAVPQTPEDWLMGLCKRLKTLTFTVN